MFTIFSIRNLGRTTIDQQRQFIWGDSSETTDPFTRRRLSVRYFSKTFEIKKKKKLFP